MAVDSAEGAAEGVAAERAAAGAAEGAEGAAEGVVAERVEVSSTP